MIKWYGLIVVMGIGCCVKAQQPFADLQRFGFSGEAQGTTYSISYFANRELVKQSQVDSIFNIIDESMSLYSPTSLISTFNNPETMEVKMDFHMAKVVKKSFQIYRMSKGIFDVTVKPLVSLWGFGPENVKNIPDSLKVKQTLQFVGMDKLKINGKRLIKINPKVSIDLNGIAQGYSVDVLSGFLRDKKIENFIVEVGGEIRTRGYKSNKETFKILVERPEQQAKASRHIIGLHNKAVTTSGSYEKFRTVDNYRFSHHIDPKTGYPLKSSIISVTVIADKALLADGLDNVFMAMSPKGAIEFANSKNNIDIYLLYLEQGVVKEAFSSGFSKYIITN